MTEKMAIPDQYWSHPVGDLLAALGSTSDGLGSAEAGLRLAQVGPNVLEVQEKATPFRSKPGKYLLIGTMLVAAVTLLLPYSPLGKLLGFTPYRCHSCWSC
jgi:hypothetical protein